jgi:Domain of unknown function (DUF927)
MSPKGTEAVRKLVEQAEEVRLTQYVSVGFYQMDDDGLIVRVTKGKGDEQTAESIFVSGPFEILGRVRDPKGEGWARLLRWNDADNRVPTPFQTPTCTAISRLSARIWQGSAFRLQPAPIANTWSTI